MKSEEEVLNGKEEGIRYLCKTHLYMSMRNPCHKCLVELGLSPSEKPFTPLGRNNQLTTKEGDDLDTAMEAFLNTKLP